MHSIPIWPLHAAVGAATGILTGAICNLLLYWSAVIILIRDAAGADVIIPQVMLLGAAVGLFGGVIGGLVAGRRRATLGAVAGGFIGALLAVPLSCVSLALVALMTGT